MAEKIRIPVRSIPETGTAKRARDIESTAFDPTPAKTWNRFFGLLGKEGPAGNETGAQQPREAGRMEELRCVRESVEYRKMAFERFGAGDFAGAEGFFTKSIDSFPFGDAYLYRAVSKICAGFTVSGKSDFRKAAEFLRIEIASSPESPQLHLNMGQALFFLGRFADAAQEWEQAAALLPENAKIYEQIGVARQCGGDFAGAIEAFRAAIAKDDRLDFSHYSIGVIWMEEYKQYREALIHLERALARNPGSPDTLCAISEANNELGNYPEAYENARAALSLMPKSEKARGIERDNDVWKRARDCFVEAAEGLGAIDIMAKEQFNTGMYH